jgi:hypothetical protein
LCISLQKREHSLSFVISMDTAESNAFVITCRSNIFMYGNSVVNELDALKQSRMFPYVMSKLCSFFSYDSSRYVVQKSKESTARVTLWRELKNPHVYTLEASFCGANIVSCHYN